MNELTSFLKRKFKYMKKVQTNKQRNKHKEEGRYFNSFVTNELIKTMRKILDIQKSKANKQTHLRETDK